MSTGGESRQKRPVVFSTCMEHELHFGAPSHPEKPERLLNILKHLKQQGLLSDDLILPHHIATDDDLLLAHTKEHVKKVQDYALQHVSNGIQNKRELREWKRRMSSEAKVKIDGKEVGLVKSMGDLFTTVATPEVAMAAVGASVKVVEEVVKSMEGDGKEAKAGFAIVRPPGHHAGKDTAMGFCFFNNATIAALHAVERLKVPRVCVFDWDVHHGNGSQDILYEDGRVLFASVHRYGKGFYPGTGKVEEVGSGGGKGRIVNLPVEGRGMGDEYYMKAMDELFLPVFAEYEPNLVIVSAGFDAAEGDPLGGMKVTPVGFAKMLHSIQATLPDAGIVLILEGGYNVNILSECSEACVRILAGETVAEVERRFGVGGEEEGLCSDMGAMMVMENPAKAAKEKQAAHASLLAARRVQAEHWREVQTPDEE
eukprot:CAMPEP_0113893924 /NCGR_PEP_ID=MMETSP0780_2-20120614/16387_1 /TAXON_ID=652834 /ORGANISM="Palpitomonas bilix" /LENGTH=425 /DNA_ID=CAMNT_0000884317 /DNA_START=397 /DNA_END=1674 /DNA_ORIENTATION=- /assembly_acc=CAM_ASM_000599